jgi:rod shape-determining protein MreC
VAVAFVALILASTGRLQPIEQGALQVFSPIQYALTRLLRSLDGLRDTIGGIGRLQQANEELRRQVESLSTQVEILREAQIENEALREQLGFAEAHPSLEILPAEVIGRDPSNVVHSLIIDRGSDDGVARDMPVITSRGLVGRVAEVHRTSATVLLLTDASSSVTGLVQRTRASGVVQGRMGRSPVMKFVSQDEPLEVGDVVLTSGLGGNFPKRLLIGHITSVTGGDIDLFQEAEIRPAVDTGRLELVMVITDFYPVESDATDQATP